MVFAFSTLGFWQTLPGLPRYRWRLSRYSVGLMGLCVEGVFRTVSHATLCLLLFALRCFALHALRSSRCMCFAFSRCATGGNGFNDACNDVKHGAIP